MLRQTQALSPKLKLNQTLRSWLPILQSSLDELKETLEPFVENNPFASIEQNSSHVNSKRNFFKEISKNSISDTLEATSIQKQSLYEKLYEQINPPLFPTLKSQNIAYKIIECINNEGYFEYDDEILSEFDDAQVESIRARFAYLEPSGVGAKSLKESFLFQLEEVECEAKIYENVKKIIDNFEDIEQMTKLKGYKEALELIKKFKNPPAIEYLEDMATAVADIAIKTDDNGISVSVNDGFYPEILLDTQGLDEANEFVSSRIKEARALIDALEMRKATLYKIGLMIVEYQYDYFFGGDIKPMKLKNLADDLGRNPSTISRAIANKYLECSRGTIPLKKFFATGLDEEVSNEAIKGFLLELIKKESPQKPLSDLKILELIKANFNIPLVRRTITKYRKSLNIGSSSERKKIYAIKH
ncbi:RNA polymerase factor sigma-54 [Campylobacter sp. RM13119]|uniref:RNA polymerase factor sigma-54 n=1 Tax=Campylobacter californiensis TaxID=1032243 RepID=UPI0014765EA1|nr:RNA polymerase factor sigma-54 [Campylobacter sp. RM13119]MBE3605531.1 RNA polymerase factor sigma-54 [Campylobacter sp. RM13119]